jgi:hypothetical protein
MPRGGIKPASDKGVIFVEGSCDRKLSSDRSVSATYAAQEGCPNDCPFLHNGCYAETGRVNFTLKRLKTGFTPEELAEQEADMIRASKGKRPLRLHVVGDAKTKAAVETIAAAAAAYRTKRGQPVWAYTHVHHIPRASWGKVSVLRSCHNLNQVKRAHEAGYASALVVSAHPDAKKKDLGDGFTGIPCVAQTTKNRVPCDECRLCWNDDRLHERKKVILFALHGLVAVAKHRKRMEEEGL